MSKQSAGDSQTLEPINSPLMLDTKASALDPSVSWRQRRKGTGTEGGQVCADKLNILGALQR